MTECHVGMTEQTGKIKHPCCRQHVSSSQTNTIKHLRWSEWDLKIAVMSANRT